MERDIEATLTRVAQIGYKEVEFAGYYNRTATEIKAMLESLELTSPSAHVSRDLIRDNPMPSIEAAPRLATKLWCSIGSPKMSATRSISTGLGPTSAIASPSKPKPPA